jgi:hypothetical protein
MEEPWQTFDETKMPFSIIIPWRGGNPFREESLKNMLNCLSVQQTPASKEKITCEIILVEHLNTLYPKEVARNNTLALVPEKILKEDYPFSAFKHIQLSTKDNAFNKSWCMNVGVRASQYNDLIFVDADSLMGHDYLRSIKYEIRKTPYPANQMIMLWNYLVKLHGKDEPITRFVRPDMTRALGGIWYANKNFYWNNFGGMNENYAGYGGEDNDGFERAIFALKQLGVNASYLVAANYPLVHQYHDNEPQSLTVPLWLKSRANPHTVITRLINVELGKIEKPTLILMDDLSGE